jgi:hypothetical protein
VHVLHAYGRTHPSFLTFDFFSGRLRLLGTVCELVDLFVFCLCACLVGLATFAKTIAATRLCADARTASGKQSSLAAARSKESSLSATCQCTEGTMFPERRMGK